MDFDFDPFVIVSTIFVVHFVATWVGGMVRREGMMDVWHLTVGYQIVLPIFVMTPFAMTPVSLWQIRQGEALRPYFEQGFVIHVIGYLAMLAGSGAYRWRAAFGGGVAQWADRRVQQWAEFAKTVAGSPMTLTLVWLAYMALVALYLSVIPFDRIISLHARQYVQQFDEFRPLQNFLFPSLHPILFFMFVWNYLERPGRLKFCALTLFVAVGVFSASRSILLDPGASLLAMWMNRQTRPLQALPIVFAASVPFLALMSLVSTWRSSAGTTQFSVFDKVLVDTFHGNTFTDLREFATVLAASRSDYLLGGTYLAGLMGFIPRSLSDYRDHWALGAYLTRLLGLDPHFFNGPFAGAFAEAYLNFWLVGVVVIGFVLSYSMRAISDRVRALQLADPARSNLIFLSGIVLARTMFIPICNSGAMFQTYSIILVLAAFWLVRNYLLVVDSGVEMGGGAASALPTMGGDRNAR